MSAVSSSTVPTADCITAANGEPPLSPSAVLEPARGGADRVEIRAAREPRLRLDERRRARLRRPPPPRCLAGARSRGSRRGARAARRGRRRRPTPPRPRTAPRCDAASRTRRTSRDRLRRVVEREPRSSFRRRERAEIDAAAERLGGEHAGELLPRRRETGRGGRDLLDVVAQRHGSSIESRAWMPGSSSRRSGRRTTATPGSSRSARIRAGAAFLVSRIPPDAKRVLDVATGTGAVALELVAARPTPVVGIDQSPEMLAVARERAVAERVELHEGRAESLPFADGEFDALTFTYLLRYVDDVRGDAARARARRAARRRRRDAGVRPAARRLAAAVGALRPRRLARSPAPSSRRAGTRSGASSARASATSGRSGPSRGSSTRGARRASTTCARAG